MAGIVGIYERIRGYSQGTCNGRTRSIRGIGDGPQIGQRGIRGIALTGVGYQII